VVGLMAYFPDTRVALYVGPVFLVLLTVLFYVFKLQPTGETQGAVRSVSKVDSTVYTSPGPLVGAFFVGASEAVTAGLKAR
jgi:hypothetical protein